MLVPPQTTPAASRGPAWAPAPPAQTRCSQGRGPDGGQGRAHQESPRRRRRAARREVVGTILAARLLAREWVEADLPCGETCIGECCFPLAFQHTNPLGIDHEWMLAKHSPLAAQRKPTGCCRRGDEDDHARRNLRPCCRRSIPRCRATRT